MTTDAFTRPLPGARPPAGSAAARVFNAQGMLILVAMCLCAAAGLVTGLVTGAHDGKGAAAATGRAVIARRAGGAVASGPQVAEATRRALHALGMRGIASCDASCAMQPPVAARRIAADRVQAVIVSAPNASAAALVHDLRQAGSHAMVVLTAPAEPVEVVRRLPGDERAWLAAAVGDAGASASVTLATIGRDGDLLD